MMNNKGFTPTTVTMINNVNTPIIFYAVCNSRVKIVKCLVEELDADLDFEYNGETALTTSIIYNFIEKFRYLLSVDRLNINQITRTKSNAVVLACQHNKDIFFAELKDQIRVDWDVLGEVKEKSQLSRKAVEWWFHNKIIKLRLFLFWKPFSERSIFASKIPKALIKEIALYL